MSQPTDEREAKRRILEVLDHGQVIYSTHAEKEMAADGIVAADVERVLRGGVVEPPEPVGSVLRFRVRASKVHVVVEFDEDEDSLVIVVTAWRKK